MSEVQKITVSSQLKSANAVTDVANHSGKENRETYAHKNPDIDKTKSYQNVELDFYDRRELLGEHYKDTIEKHNENKNNKSEERRWDLDKYLETFEGKTVMRKGEMTKNARWSTASQISYFGGKDSLNPVLEALEEAGAPPEAIREAYASGYKEYVQKHNEKFWTLPIYHSDIHFDETTFHGHDAMVVKGHTQKGRASDSINNALGEMYGYKAGFKGNQENMVQYREENDAIIFDAIGSKLEALGGSYGVDVEFEFLRTGQTDSDGYQDYKKKMDYQNAEDELQETHDSLEMRSKAQAGISKKNVTKKRELDGRDKELNQKESDLGIREASVIAKEKEQQEKEQKAAERQAELNQQAVELKEKQISLGNQILEYKNVAEAVAIGVLEGDSKYAHWVERIKDKEKGIFSIKTPQLTGALVDSISRVQQGKRGRLMGDKNFINQQIARQEAENDGPEL